MASLFHVCTPYFFFEKVAGADSTTTTAPATTPLPSPALDAIMRNRTLMCIPENPFVNASFPCDMNGGQITSGIIFPL